LNENFTNSPTNSLNWDVPREVSWRYLLEKEFSKPYYKRMMENIRALRKDKIICPQEYSVFNAFNSCGVWETKVVIVSSEPYPSLEMSTGLPFSVPYFTEKKDFPASLKNVFKAIKLDIGVDCQNGDLTPWAQQGVFMLNRVLTVEEKKPRSHASFGWKEFTDAAVDVLLVQARPLVWCLWGKEAQELKSRIQEYGAGHLILETSSPSPLTVGDGFLWCKHFSKANEFLVKNNYSPIKWGTETFSWMPGGY
jgi:uracil-DNA glycosylase